MATKRKSLSKKIRFEVFKRDSFKCQYCGQSAPDVILEVDHIDPISKDGSDEMVNYITACKACNAGKSDRKLDDHTTLAKQKAQLHELNDRREQLEMMVKWRSGMKDLKDSQINALEAAWKSVSGGWYWNETGRKEVRSLLRKYSISVLFDSIEEAGDKYIKKGEDGLATKDTVNLAFSKIGGIARMKSLPDDDRELHYVKGILRNRLSYVPNSVYGVLKNAYEKGVPIDAINQEARAARTWSRFESWLNSAIEENNG